MIFILIAKPVMCAPWHCPQMLDIAMYRKAIERMMYLAKSYAMCHHNGTTYLFELLPLQGVSLVMGHQLVQFFEARTVARVIPEAHEYYHDCERVIMLSSNKSVGPAFVLEKSSDAKVDYEHVLDQMSFTQVAEHDGVTLRYEPNVHKMQENCRYVWPSMPRAWEHVKCVAQTCNVQFLEDTEEGLESMLLGSRAPTPVDFIPEEEAEI